jgi:hypothetical protein
MISFFPKKKKKKKKNCTKIQNIFFSISSPTLALRVQHLQCDLSEYFWQLLFPLKSTLPRNSPEKKKRKRNSFNEKKKKEREKKKKIHLDSLVGFDNDIINMSVSNAFVAQFHVDQILVAKKSKIVTQTKKKPAQITHQNIAQSKHDLTIVQFAWL